MNYYLEDKDTLEIIAHIKSQEINSGVAINGLNDFIFQNKDIKEDGLYYILLNLSYIISTMEHIHSRESSFIWFINQDKFYIVWERHFTLYKTIYKLNRNENKFKFYKELTLDYILNEENYNEN